MLRINSITTATALVAAAVVCFSPLGVAAPPQAVSTRRQIEDALKSLEMSLARGDSATVVAKSLYAEEDLLTGEGEDGGTRGMTATIKDVQGWMDSLGPGGTKGCKYTIVDPVVSSSTTFSSFLLLKCKANPPVLKADQELRMMYVWKKFPVGWRVVLEMYESGKL